MEQHSFTIEYPTVAMTLLVNAKISKAFDPSEKGDHPKIEEFVALWDTGATTSSITKNVVDRLNLAQSGFATVNHAGGESRVNTYFVNILLPNNVGVSGVKVTEGILHGFDILIGMDIISHGDFIISNANGKTTFGFRLPSSNQIPFQNESYNNHMIIKQNIDKFEHPCICGSGKKYKDCHGKGLK